VEGHEVALILIDLWERHHCIPMEIRGAILAKKVNQLLPTMRGNGIRIIHAPSLRAKESGFAPASGKFYELEKNDPNGFRCRKAFLDAQVSPPEKGLIRDLQTDDKMSQIWWNPDGKKDVPSPGLQLWVYPLRQDGCDGASDWTGHWPPDREHPSKSPTLLRMKMKAIGYSGSCEAETSSISSLQDVQRTNASSIPETPVSII
jgi:hypothetical protein